MNIQPAEILDALGLALAHDEGWTTRWLVAGRSGADVEIVFVEPASPRTGVLVVPGGDRRQGQARRCRFVAGYLDPRRYRELGGVRFRTGSAEGEWPNAWWTPMSFRSLDSESENGPRVASCTQVQVYGLGIRG